MPTPRRFNVPELDGVRCLAFLAVLVVHAVPVSVDAAARGLSGSIQRWAGDAVLAGAFGVDLFFVLSGFLITTLLLREGDERGRIDVPAFWIRRILRIWPLYYAFVVACWALEGLPGNVVAAFLLLCGNWGPLLFTLPAGSSIGPLWSISIEEQFYLVWPVLVAWTPRRSLRAVCLSMIAAALVVRVVILVTGGCLSHVWMNTFARLDPIAVGALIALYYRRASIALGPRARTALIVGASLTIVAMVTLLTRALVRPAQAWARDHGDVAVREGLAVAATTSLVFLVVALCCGVIVATALAGRSWLGHPALVHLGRISYGLYVFHWPAIKLVGALWWPWRLALSFMVSLALAEASYRLLEGPFLRMKDRFAYVATRGSGP